MAELFLTLPSVPATINLAQSYLSCFSVCLFFSPNEVANLLPVTVNIFLQIKTDHQEKQIILITESLQCSSI